jgi:hypothetical protein
MSYSPVYTAIINNNIEQIRELIIDGLDVNKPIIDEYTPIFIAVDKGRLEIVKELIGAGADINKLFDNAFTVLNIAIERGYIEIVKALIDAGADINIIYPDNLTPLSIAVEYKRLEIVQLLIDAGADVDTASDYDHTPLAIATRIGNTAIVRALLDAGASITSNIITDAINDEYIPEINTIILDRLSLNTHPKPLTNSNKCYDPIMANEVNINTHNTTFYVLKEDGSVAFIACLDSDSLYEYLSRNDYIFYRCKDSVPPSALLIRRNKDIHGKPIRLLNFQQRVYLYDDISQRLQMGKQYVCIPIERVGRLVSEDYLATGNAVSALHCQPDDGSMLYTLKEIIPSAQYMNGGNRRRKRSYKYNTAKQNKKTKYRYNTIKRLKTRKLQKSKRT